MKFQGDITAIPITDVAQNLSSNRKTGTLTIRQGEDLRWLVFREGKIASYSDNIGFSVPGWLEGKGLVDPAVLRKAVAKARKAKRDNLGAFLERAKALKEEEYLHHLKTLFLEMLYETFTFRGGTFEFHENAVDSAVMDPEIVGAKLELAVGPILIESARQLDDWETFRKCLPSENDIYRVSPSEKKGRLRELGDDEVLAAAVELLDGTRTIREVIASIPASRFEACRAIADLVVRKWAKPIQGEELLGHLGAPSTPRQKARALVQMKAALEREPGNRVLLQRVAEMAHALGKKEESGVYLKLLAPALLEDGDRAGAERALRQSLKLNPKDIGTWQKLYEVLEQGGEERALLAFGNEMTKHLRRLGLEELARNHLSRMLVRFPALASLRFAHAESLFALGCKEEAVEELLNLARDLLKKGRLDEGERALAKIIEYDHEHKRAREIYEKVRSGKLARQRARRRQLLRSSIAAVLLAAIFVFLGYDFFARREFALATRQVFAEGLIERGQYQAAAERLTKALDRHALSLVRFLEGRELLEAIREAQARRESAIGPPAISPQEKAEASSQGLKTKPSASAKSSPPSGQAARSSQPGGVGMKKTAKSGK